MDIINVKIKNLTGDARIPAYQTPGSAACDLCAAIGSPVTIEPGKSTLIPTGIAIAPEESCVCLLFARSGLAVKHGITLSNSVGVIDQDYHINKPLLVQEATRKYRENNDWLSQFIEECCEVDGSYSEKSSEVYNAYRSYCTQVGDYIRSTTDFYTALECAGFERKRSKSARLILGLHLKSDFLD